MKTNTKTMVLIAVLTAMSAVLMIFPQFSVIPSFGWLKFDFADIPALLSAVAISPLAGGIIVVIRNLLHFLIMPDPILLSELGNMIVSFVLVVTAGIMCKYTFKKTVMRKKLLIVLPIASLLQVLAGILSNLYIMIPMYGKFVDFNAIGVDNYIIYGVIPFNLLKDIVSCVVFYLLYRYIYPQIQKRLY